MRHTIKCTICLIVAKVNGQNGIDKFRNEHHHLLSQSAIKTGLNLEIDNQQDRIDLGLDKPFARLELSIFCQSTSYREDGKKIAEISREGFLAMEEAAANAHLIASAPAIYEALKVAERWCKERLSDDHVDMEMIQLALAKAEGK